jgi:CubicO group peptidase (beta-lactamase class C family)
MEDTMFYVPEQKKARLADCYEQRSVCDAASTHASVCYKVSENMERDKSVRFPMLAGGGGLCATIDDYRRFACLLLRRGATEGGKQLLSEELVDAMTTNQLPGGTSLSEFSFEKGGFSESIGEGIGYGFGVSVVTEPSLVRGGESCTRGEFGWGGMASTWFFICPTKRLYAVLLTSLIPSSASTIS